MTPVQQSGSGFNNASLYVGDLNHDVTEALLFKIFNAVGPVASIRVCRDAVTRHSLGYAYVNFHDVSDAERALDTMNYTAIRGRPCRIMWSQRDPSRRKSGVGNVFVKNLDKSIDSKTLHDTFSMFGDILSCRVALDPHGASLGHGFVHYRTEESAKKAIEKVNNMTIADKQVYVAPFRSRKDRGVTKRIFTNVYFKGFPKDWDEIRLREYAEKFGVVSSTHIGGKDQENDQNKPPSPLKASTRRKSGFGFVNFENADDAERCVEQLNGMEIPYEPPAQDGDDNEEAKREIDQKPWVLYVARAQKKKEREGELKKQREEAKAERQKKYQGQMVNLYVKNLVDSFDDAKLRELFEQYGTITSCKVMLDPATGKSRGFGFVCFANKEMANNAMNEMNSKIIEGKPLYVGLAQRKDARRAALEQQARRRATKTGQHNTRSKGGAGGPFGAPQRGGPAYVGGGRGAWRVPGPGPHNPSMMGRAPWFAGAGTPGTQPGHQWNGQMMRPGMMAGRGVPGMGPYSMSGMPSGPSAMMPGGPPGPQTAGGGPSAAGRGAGPAQSGPAGGTGKLNPSTLANADPIQQKQMIGEKIFPLIQAVEPRLAGKITGMLLEMDNTELLHLIESQDALMSKINEALTVLKQYNDSATSGAAAAAE